MRACVRASVLASCSDTAYIPACLKKDHHVAIPQAHSTRCLTDRRLLTGGWFGILWNPLPVYFPYVETDLLLFSMFVLFRCLTRCLPCSVRFAVASATSGSCSGSSWHIWACLVSVRRCRVLQVFCLLTGLY